MQSKRARPARIRRWLLWPVLVVLALGILATLAWTTWSERHPESERELRIEVQQRLQEWFPEQMTLPDELIGFIPRSARFEPERRPDVILVHGLDEPGGIWDALVERLDAAGFNAWEFRFPNDQAIDHSTDLLARYWAQLPAPDGHDITLIGHSMGGLVIRDFITRWRHPADRPPGILGARVDGAILVAPPNQGSEWARLRAWLELREFQSDIAEGRFSLFAGLRDGTGAAKIDLRPGSAFLEALNDRDWPESVDLHIIGGLITEPTPAMTENLRAVGEDLELPGLAEQIEDLWTGTGENLGDGAVPIESLAVPGGPEPLVVNASHRGLLVPGPLGEGPPPAIEPIIDRLQLWREPVPAGERPETDDVR